MATADFVRLRSFGGAVQSDDEDGSSGFHAIAEFRLNGLSTFTDATAQKKCHHEATMALVSHKVSVKAASRQLHPIFMIEGS